MKIQLSVLLRTCALVCLASLAWAQNETAVLAGRAVDPSGLGVPNVNIRLTEESTGATRDTISQPDGLYRFELLPPGRYSIHATVMGFKTFEDSHLRLDVAKAATFEIALTLGQVTESVVVEESVSPLTTTSVALGTVIGEESVKALPLNGRQFLQLALLSPGTNSGGLAVQQN
jgi:hypothetical protein